MPATLSPFQIIQTNYPVWAAIAAVRIERSPATMSELYDALNRRSKARASHMPEATCKAWDDEVERDIFNYGQVERTHQELAMAVASRTTNHNL